MRVVLDTVVFVRGLINPHAACGELVFGYAARYRLFLSHPVLAEYLEVLARPELTAKFKTLAERSPRHLLALIAQAEAVTIGRIPSASRDAKDNMFLATASAAEAEYLVSEDRDLLDLASHDETQIVTCLEFLAILRERFGR